ncbi:MAG TPA: GH25 family lysozyme [Polyangiaceae bacterium]|nr:GH25 family lysozyme [Polyangiaceae bacterium]
MARWLRRNGDGVDVRAAFAVAAALLPMVGCSGSPYDATGESSDEVRVCPATTTVEGIDVSYYQKTINWQQVKASGIQFAVTRISDGLNFPDSEFADNWAGIKSVGLIRGAYQYFEPGQDALAQADMVVQRVGMLGAGDLPVQLDMEATGGQSSANIASKMKTWMDRVTTGTGKRPFIYTAKYFWNDNVASRDFSADRLWVANYGVTCPDLPDAWSNWSIWQYSSTGTVSGIAGDVDLDRFNGSLDDLKKITGTSAPFYAAEYVAQSFPLASAGMTMTGNAKVSAYIELKNIGTKTWDSNTRLATSNPRDRPSMFAASDWLDPTRLAAVQGTVPPGATYRFQFTLQAPAASGVYAEYFNVVEDGVAWFSDPGQGGPPDNQLQNRITVTGGAPTDASTDGAGGDAGTVRPDVDAGGGGGNTLDAPGKDAGSGMTPDAAVSRDAGDPSGDASTRDASGSGLAPPGEDDAGCGCRLASPRSDRGERALGWAALACVLARRRRRHSPGLTRSA